MNHLVHASRVTSPSGPVAPRRSAHTTWHRPTILLLAIAVVLTGCAGVGRDPDAALRAGPGSGNPADAAAVRAAAGAALDAGGADIAVAAQGPARGRQVQTTGNGTVDLRRRGTQVSLTVGELGTVRARMRDTIAYAALPPRAVGGIARGRGWVSVDLQGADRGLYADTIIQLGTGVTGNPADIPTVLAELGDRDAVMVGPDTVEGIPTTRYRVVVDLVRVAGKSRDLSRVLARYRTDTAAAGVPTARLPMEVWIGQDGALRRAAQLVGGAHAVSTVTFLAFGPRPSVPAPPAERVTDLLASLSS